MEFTDGRVGATAHMDRPAAKKSAATEPKPVTSRRSGKPAGQGSLF
jgi:hypothetical protein